MLDTDRRLLTHADVAVHLPPKTFRLLELLIAARPKVISNQELCQALWPDTFVARTNLPSLVAELRKAIGDPAKQPQLIRTVHAFGYAFIGDAIVLAAAGEPDAPDALTFRLILDGREVTLGPGENLLGRTADAAVWLEDVNVSRRHARIMITGREATLEDLDSKNGTFLEGRRIESATTLANGNVIWVGPFSLTFRAYPANQSTLTAADRV